jgi:hypothetical protein
MKRLYATKTLQKDKLYKEIQDNIQGYYKLSIEKEQKQKSYLQRLKVFNTTSRDYEKLNYDFERNYKEYARLTQQKISTIEQIAKDRGYVSLFITLTLPSKFHPFKSIAYKNNKRLYTQRNKEFIFDNVSDAIKNGYKFLNELFQRFYKRIKFFTKKELLYAKSVEFHSSLIPHVHCVLFFPLEKYDEVVGVYKRIIEHYKLDRVDIETVNMKDDINYASRYILKYIVKTLNDNSDYFQARVLDGQKRANKLRLLSHSQIPLNQEIYKKIYHSFTNIKKNKIFSKKDYKLFIGRKEIDNEVRTNGIPYYYFFQQNLYLEQKIYSADSKCSKTKISKLGNVNSLFHIKLEKVRSRDSKGRLTYKIKRLVIRYRGIEIYQNSKYLILKDYS